jgi:hypothetical protein
MKPYLLLLLSLVSLCAFSQKNSIINEYDKLFSLNVYEENGKLYHNLKINEIEPSHPLSGLINDDKLYVDYIYTNFSSVSKEKIKELSAVPDSAKRNQEFLSLLKNDDLFNKYFSSMVKYYLGSQSNKYAYSTTFNKKDTIALDSLVTIATHFFYLNRITPRGCHWAVCVGNNGYKNSGKTDSSPLIEAFCFNAVLGNIFSEEYQYRLEYDSIKNAINPTNFEGTQEEKIEKMRSTMYKNMQNSESLRKMLRVEYLKMSEKLSFILTD